MTAMFSGLTGLPLYSVTVGLIQGLFGASDDDDEPVPFEERDMDYWFRYVFLPKYFGDDMAKIIQKGPISVLSNVDIAASTSLDNLWFRDQKDDKTTFGDITNQLVGMAGPTVGLVKNFSDAYDDWKNGHVSQAIEKALPAAFKGTVAQQRWGEEGINTKTQKAELINKDEVTTAMRFWKTLGFNPTELSIQQDKNFKVIENIRKTNEEYADIMKHIKTNSLNGNMKGLEKDFEDFANFAKKNPDMEPDVDSIFSAIDNAEKARAEAINGVVVSNEKLRARAAMLLQNLPRK
jgi:hypothetical protein